MSDDGDRGGEPPCLAPLIVGGHAVDSVLVRDVARFRQAERARFYALRRGVSAADQRRAAHTVATALDSALTLARGEVLSAYWPIRGELDLRFWLAAQDARGIAVALPVIAARAVPLVFRRWRPGSRMIRSGVWGIPEPAEGEIVIPDVVVAPLVGVDAACHRLGNGGGYFDRTLAGLAPREIVGVGHGFARLPTIHPMPWDVPMTLVALSDGTVRRP
jgi:5,10-methenyltetrahydrofolate synthetase